MKTFDPTKPVRTRDGKPARILCTDRYYEGQRHAPILALVSEKNGENPSWHHSDGTAFGAGLVRPSSRDLVNYDPFEITDEEAELIIDILYWRGAIGSKMCQTADKIRKRDDVLNGFYVAVRDMVIKHRKSQ